MTITQIVMIICMVVMLVAVVHSLVRAIFPRVDRRADEEMASLIADIQALDRILVQMLEERGAKIKTKPKEGGR